METKQAIVDGRRVKLTWDNLHGTWRAAAKDAPGCVGYGQTHSEALAEFSVSLRAQADREFNLMLDNRTQRLKFSAFLAGLVVVLLALAWAVGQV